MSEDTENLTQRAADLEKRLADMEASTNARLIRAELKSEAIRAGMLDLDGLKLIDTSGLELTDKGELSNAATIMTQLRRSKPWLFGGGSSSSTASPPPATAPVPKLATEMSYTEWQAARAALLRHR